MYPSSGTWTAVQSFSFHSHVHQVPGRVTLCGYVERQDKFAFMFWSEVHQQVVEKMTLLRASHQSCPLFGRFQEREMVSERRLPETSDVMVCLMNSHDELNMW